MVLARMFDELQSQQAINEISGLAGGARKQESSRELLSCLSANRRVFIGADY